jgi:hypothetical protein
MTKEITVCSGCGQDVYVVELRADKFCLCCWVDKKDVGL